MVRLPALMLPVALALGAATGCVTTRPIKAEKLNEAIKEVVPASALAVGPKSPPATQFATAWQTKLGQLPDPTKNGAMNPGVVGQAFLYTDKFAPADIAGSLTIVANDATTRPEGMPARQPNVWHFDAETLKKMVVNDDRFGKSLAIFLPWPEEWTDVNRLLIQARYDQPGTYPLFAPQSTVTLDFFTTGSQVTIAQAKQSAAQMSVPDPKVLMQNSQPRGVPPQQPNFGFPPVTNPVQPVGHNVPAAAWPPVGMMQPPAVQQHPQQPPQSQQPQVLNLQQQPPLAPPQQPPVVGAGQPIPPFGTPQPPADGREFQRTVIPRK